MMFARVTEGSVPDIVTESYRLNKIKVEIQRFADSSRNTGDQLNVKGTSRYIVVAIEGKDLSFVGVAVIIRAMQNFIYVADKSGAPDVGGVLVRWESSCDHIFAKTKRRSVA
jgi:uncharacterized protein (UPF0303 family)